MILKKLAIRVFLLIFGLSLGFFLAEISARYYLKYTGLGEKIRRIEDRLNHPVPYHCSRLNSDLGRELIPGVVDKITTSDFDVEYSVSSKGIRDKDISFDKPEGEFRIIALGESNVFGIGVNYGERFTEVIEQALKNVEVINMGVGAYGMDQAFLFLKRDGFRFNPDLVILFITTPDYLDRCKYFRLWSSFKPRFVLSEDKNELLLHDIKFIIDNYDIKRKNLLDRHPEDEAKIKKNRVSLFNNIRLLTVLDFYRRKKKIEDSLRECDEAIWGSLPSRSNRERGAQVEYNETDFRRLIFLLFKEYKKLCAEHKSDLLVVFMPRISFAENFCRELGIPYLDLSDVLRQAAKTRSLRFEIDLHFNEFAHRIIGEYTSEYLSVNKNLEKNKNYHYQSLGKF